MEVGRPALVLDAEKVSADKQRKIEKSHDAQVDENCDQRDESSKKFEYETGELDKHDLKTNLKA